MTQKSENGRRRMLGTSSILTATNSVLPTAGSTGDDVLSILLEGNSRPGFDRIMSIIDQGGCSRQSDRPRALRIGPRVPR